MSDTDHPCFSSGVLVSSVGPRTADDQPCARHQTLRPTWRVQDAQFALVASLLRLLMDFHNGKLGKLLRSTVTDPAEVWHLFFGQQRMKVRRLVIRHGVPTLLVVHPAFLLLERSHPIGYGGWRSAVSLIAHTVTCQKMTAV